jgi:hypothetical protein
LLQRERETAEAYQAYATPSAVLVSREGMIASPVAQGEAAIRVLINSASAGARSNVNGNANNEKGNGDGALPQWRARTAASMSEIGLDAS